MKTGNVLIAASVLLLSVSGTALPSADAPPVASRDPHMGKQDLFQVTEGRESPLSYHCSDIAYSDVFKAKGLGYVCSAEFAAALRAVATGASRYSPEEIPADWRVFAKNWDMARHGLGGVRLLGDEQSLIPALVYLASMEYRSRSGRQGVKPVLPVILRAATRDMEERVAVKGERAGRFAERASAVVAMVREAEQLGAAGCAPGAIAEAKAEIDRARRDAAGIRSSVQETEAAFLRAERLADALLARQRFAVRTGLRCYGD